MNSYHTKLDPSVLPPAGIKKLSEYESTEYLKQLDRCHRQMDITNNRRPLTRNPSRDKCEHVTYDFLSNARLSSTER